MTNCACTPQNAFTGWMCPSCRQAIEDQQDHIAEAMRACHHHVRVMDGWLACPVDLCRLTSDGMTEDMAGCTVDSRAECPV